MIATPLVLLVIALAAYRLAHVIAGTDSALEEVNRAIVGWAYETDECGDVLHDSCGDPIRKQGVTFAHAKAVDLLDCPHCIGYWIGVGMLCTWLATWPWDLGWRGWITTLAIAGFQSALTSFDKR